MATNKAKKLLALMGVEGTTTRDGGEANYGKRPTTPAPSGLDAIWSFDDPNPWQADVSFVNRDPLRASYSKSAGIPGRSLITFNPRTVLQGSNYRNSGKQPYLINLMRGCGMALTSGESSNSYSWELRPKSSDFDSLFADIYLDKIYAPCAGLYGTFTMDGTAGAPIDVQFNYRGRFPTNGLSGATPPTATYPTGKRLYMERAAFQIADSQINLYVKSFRFDAGVTIEERLDANSDYGFAGLIVTDRAPKFSMVIEAEDNVATRDVIGDLQNANLKKIAFQHTSGRSVVNNEHSKFTFLANECQFRSVPMGEANGIRTYNCELDIISSTDDGDYVMTFAEFKA